MVYVFLAEGFQAMEALSPVDILRRAGIEAVTVGITGKAVRSTSGICVEADVTKEDVDLSKADMIVLPGGLPGADNLDKNSFVGNAIDYCVKNGIKLAAICAAPFILGRRGLLKNAEATCFPGYEGELEGAIISDKCVVTSAGFTTARSAGWSVEFGLELVRVLAGDEKAQAVKQSLMQS